MNTEKKLTNLENMIKSLKASFGTAASNAKMYVTNKEFNIGTIRERTLVKIKFEPAKPIKALVKISGFAVVTNSLGGKMNFELYPVGISEDGSSYAMTYCYSTTGSGACTVFVYVTSSIPGTVDIVAP